MESLRSSPAICTTPSCDHRASTICSGNFKPCSSHTSTQKRIPQPLAEPRRTPLRCSTKCFTQDYRPSDSSVDSKDPSRFGFDNLVGTLNQFRGADARTDPESSWSPSEIWRSVDGGSEMKLHFPEERDEEVLSKRIVSLSRSNKTRDALELYFSMEMAGLRSTPHSCNSLLSCVLRNETIDDVLRVFEAMRRKDIVTGHGYSLVLKAVGATRGCDCALNMFLDLEEEGLHKGKFDVIVYNTMLTICARGRKWREAERMWSQLKKHGFQGTRVTYSLLISTFVRCGQTDLALSAYSEMIQNGIQQDEGNMKAIIATCTSEGRWDIAVHVLKEMLENGSKPSILQFNAVINCLGKAGKVNHAFSIFDLMKDSGHTPDMYTWNALLNALHRSGRYADCLRLFSTICKKQRSDMNIHLFNTALMSCQKLSLWDRSLQILWLMESSEMQVPTASYNLVIGACERARKPKAALQVYQHMIHRNCRPDTFTFLTLIRTCIWGSRWTDVESILENVEPNASIYNAVIHGFCLKGRITLARKLYSQMRNRGLEADGRTRALMLQHMPRLTQKP